MICSGAISTGGVSAALWSSLRGHCVCLGAVGAGEWIVPRGEYGQWGAGADRRLVMGQMTAQRIINLLFDLRNTLVFNDVSLHYLVNYLNGVDLVGLARLIQRGGGGRGRVLGADLSIHQRLQNLFTLPWGLKIGLQKKEGGAGSPSQHTTTMSKPRCPQCRLSSTIDCLEEGCPGVEGFLQPSTWARPLMQMAQDLERHEALILECDAWFTAQQMVGDIVLKVERAAQAIRAKQKKGGAAR